MYLLDTNTIIYFFKNKGKVAEKLLSTSPEEIAIPVIALYEIEVGIAKSDRPEKLKKQLKTFVSHVTVLPFTAKEAFASASIRADLEANGTPIGPLDNLIAGIALGNNHILVTHNTDEFSRIEKLTIEDWF